MDVRSSEPGEAGATRQRAVNLNPGESFRSGFPLPPATFAGFVAAVLAVVLIALFSVRSLQNNNDTAERVTRTFEVVGGLANVLSTLKDAETGQRGFLLTGDEAYLDPYVKANAALPGEFKALHRLTTGNPVQEQRLDALERIAKVKMDELAATVALKRTGKGEEALAAIRTNRGKTAMDEIRNLTQEMEREERNVLARRQEEWQQAAAFANLVSWGGSGLLLFLIAAAAIITSRDYRSREMNAWLRGGQMGLAERMQGEQRLDVLGDNALGFLAGYMGARVGAVYIAEPDGGFRRFAGYALRDGAQAGAFHPGEGMLGQAVKERAPLHVREVPENYLTVASSVGRGKPREILVAPATIDGEVHAVVELGFFRALDGADRELMARISESLGVAVRASKDRTRLEELLEETQRQSEELQAQQEELRVNNEELEEQGRVLKESQAQLESQQVELEQTNSQLEEQARLLEAQRDDLALTQAGLTEKAAELERSSQYKSEFLANMSHELRTPLNSTLILAKLLADNKDGNLSEQQVKFAQTISSAGNDLLALINDILDLSKIEAGKMEVSSEPVQIAKTAESLVDTFQPQALQKGLALRIAFEPGVPETMETDAQRMGQILKNLLSNAIKFTHKGEVAMRVACSGGSVSFTVSDTGVGIAPDQQGFIFDAFRQADGSTHRRYGGTGLGLSISRDLARLLGGDVLVASTPGEGSAFTLVLPLAYAGPASEAAPAPAPARAPLPAAITAAAAAASPAATPAAMPRGPAVEDDRARLRQESRRILVIEDDIAFAGILRDLIREMDFQCVVATTGDEGLAAASAYRPNAILMDMHLPDQSGLSILDKLKRDPQTRHVPVHIISVADYSHEALERGAVGYALKPVKREELVRALEQLEARLSQSVKRVLVIEDDERQRESMRQLLGSGEIQITAAQNAEEALEHLKNTTFDCVVMDLNLPGLSGYQLLEKMVERDDVSFPPVIVYTGRSLSRDEEQKLRRYSRSIIVKDARSPERLLDEVTLFLHQVESQLPPESQRMLRAARNREAGLEGRRILVVEDDVRNIFALSSVLEPKGVQVQIARNGIEAIAALERSLGQPDAPIDLVLMDIMMPEMDGITAMREIRKKPEWKKLPIIALTAKAMKDDQEKCLAAGANDYVAKPLDVEKLLSLVRVWMPK